MHTVIGMLQLDGQYNACTTINWDLLLSLGTSEAPVILQVIGYQNLAWLRSTPVFITMIGLNYRINWLELIG